MKLSKISWQRAKGLKINNDNSFNFFKPKKKKRYHGRKSLTHLEQTQSNVWSLSLKMFGNTDLPLSKLHTGTSYLFYLQLLSYCYVTTLCSTFTHDSFVRWNLIRNVNSRKSWLKKELSMVKEKKKERRKEKWSIFSQICLAFIISSDT